MSIRTATLNGVATIEIARPEKKNALTIAMYQAMADALRAALNNRSKLLQFGSRGRHLLETEWTLERQTARTVALYSRLLAAHA